MYTSCLASYMLKQLPRICWLQFYSPCGINMPSFHLLRMSTICHYVLVRSFFCLIQTTLIQTTLTFPFLFFPLNKPPNQNKQKSPRGMHLFAGNLYPTDPCSVPLLLSSILFIHPLLVIPRLWYSPGLNFISREIWGKG